MRQVNLNESEIFLENIARKVWVHLDYAGAVENGLLEGSISRVLVEKIDKAELQKLDKMSKAARETIDELIADVEDLGFARTAKYLASLKKSLPGNLSLVKVALKGDPQESAKQIGRITTVITNINSVRDSFTDAVVLFGSELAKLDYSKYPEETATKAAKLAADESDSGNVVIDGEDLGTPEDVVKKAVAAFKNEPIKDIAANKFMTMVRGIKFPDTGLLTKAAQNSFKEPKKPEGYLGKVAAFFKGQTLSSKQFANDLLDTSLEKIINKAKELEAKRPEAEAEKKKIQATATALAGDLKDAATGDASAIAMGSGGGVGASQTVNVPGVGNVPVTQNNIAQIVPGFEGTPEELKGYELVSRDELERKVTAPEDVSGVTPELADLINDDPNSKFMFFDPEEVKETEEDSPSKKPRSKPPPIPAKASPEGTTAESWVHRRPLTDLLFESASSRKERRRAWTYQTSLEQSLFMEAIFYKDVAKALKAQNIADDKLEDSARELAKRLENQYGVTITGIPQLEEETVEAAQQIQQSGIAMSDVKDLLKQQGEANKEAMQLVKDILASKDESEVQRALARAEEKGVNVGVVVSATANSQAVTGAKGDDGSAKEEKKPGKKRDRTGPPTDEIKDRGKKIGLKPKKGETGAKFGRRVRVEEEKQGKRKPKKKAPSGTSQSAESKVSIDTGFGKFQVFHLFHLIIAFEFILVHSQ